MKLAFLILLFTLTAWAGDKVQIERDGGNWKVTVSGSLPPQPIFRVTTAGDLTVRGKPSREIHYSMTGKVEAPDEDAVRRVAAALQARAVNGQLYFPQPVSVRLELPRTTRMLALWSTGGAIDASGLEGSVQTTTAAGQITLDRIGGDVEIHSGGGPTSLGTIGGHVRCFSGGGPIRGVLIRGTAVIESDGGDIHLGQVVGTIRAITAAGGIRIEQAGGDVYADTFGGPISILQAAGLVVATTSGGPIDVTGASSVQCQSASGTIHLSNVSGHLRAVTERGSIVAGLQVGHRLEDSFLSTRSGDITVFLPSDTNVTIQAETSGSHNRRAIVSDFPGLDVVKRPSVSTAEGKINEGGPLLRLTGMGGRIEIKRK